MTGTNDLSIRLEGEHTIRTIGETATIFGRALHKAGPIVLDCSGISEVDISFVQLVIAARASANALGRDLRVDPPAEGALLTCLTDGGFLEHTPEIPSDRREFWLNRGGADTDGGRR